jgi:LDH2 family malate/lactate/ureidoglycolate dehydrogenase
MVTIQVENLINFVAEVFAHSDSSPEEAKRIARYLTTANLTGHDSHGVIRVPAVESRRPRLRGVEAVRQGPSGVLSSSGGSTL